jgi:hypothetical protein
MPWDMSGASNLPMPFKPQPRGRVDLEHHTGEWTSGSRGGGFVPPDFEWGTNPKQHQEENGSAAFVDAPAAPSAPPKP